MHMAINMCIILHGCAHGIIIYGKYDRKIGRAFSEQSQAGIIILTLIYDTVAEQKIQ